MSFAEIRGKFLTLLLLVFVAGSLHAQNTKINPDQIRSGAFPGVYTFNSLNNIIYVDGIVYPRTSAGIQAAITAALAVSPGGSSVILTSGTYTITGNITGNCGVSLRGVSRSGVILNSSFNGNAFTWTTSPFTVAQCGDIGGFTLNGNSSSSAVGFYVHDTQGLHFHDLTIQNFTGTSSVGVWLDNVTNWTERTYIEPSAALNNNTKSVKLSVSGSSSNSFAATYLEPKLNANAGQIGISVENNALLYGGAIRVFVNIADAGTALKLTGTASLSGNEYQISAEQTSGAGGVGISMAAGTAIDGWGQIKIDSPLTNSLSGSVNPESAILWRGPASEGFGLGCHPGSSSIVGDITACRSGGVASGTVWLGSDNNGYISKASTVVTVGTGGGVETFPANVTGTLSNAIVEYCGATSGASQPCAKTVQTLPIEIWGEVTLNTATTQSITTLPFTDALYSCSGSDLTTAAGIVSFNTYASASVTIQESGGVNTDHLRYHCVGH